MKSIIKNILHNHSIIDTGIAEEIEETLDPIIQQTIWHELNMAEIASKAMTGLLSNNSSEIMSMDYHDIAEHSVNSAIALMQKLDEVRDKDNAH